MNIPEEITIIPPPEPEQVLPQSQPQLETPSEKKPSVEQILDEMKTEAPLPEEPLPEVLEFPITEEECQMWLISGYSIPMLYYDVDVTETTERLAKIRGKQLYFILKRYKILEKIKYIDIMLLVIGIGGDITIIARECKATNQEKTDATNQEAAKQKTAAEGEVK